MTISPGLATGTILFALALSWTTYAVYLPQLAKAAGIPASFVPWMLALDQLVFAAADWASGAYADRTLAIMRGLVPTLVLVTMISTIAFAMLPLIGPLLGADGFFFLTITWVVTTAALRAPPMAMLGNYATPIARPALAALSTIALALAAAIAPYLAMTLRSIDPRLPFALAAIAVMTAALGLFHVDRTLPKSIKMELPQRSVRQPRQYSPSTPVFAAIALTLAIGFQAQVLMSAGQLARVLPKDLIEYYMPLFWGAFAAGGVIAAILFKRVDARITMVAASLAAASGALLGAIATTAQLVSIVHIVVGIAWGVLLTGLFATALTSGPVGTAGRAAGIVFAALALSAFMRIAVATAGWQGSPVIGDALAWIPGLAWLTGAALIAFTTPGISTGPSTAGDVQRR
ncbi:MAG: MFS transporter [Burkholderiales bacterium]